MSKDKEPCEFTCKICGSHNLEIIHVYDEAGVDQIVDRANLKVKIIHYTVHYEDIGHLDRNHEFELDEGISYDDEDQMEELSINADELDQYIDRDPPAELVKDSESFTVRCSECKREVEFGWSRPYRRGVIQPAECFGFDPWKVWPDPNHYDNWKKKGWLRPGTTALPGFMMYPQEDN